MKLDFLQKKSAFNHGVFRKRKISAHGELYKKTAHTELKEIDAELAVKKAGEIGSSTNNYFSYPKISS